MSLDSNKIGGKKTEYITSPVQASPANDAEFVDSPGTFKRFGLKRSLLYALETDGLIKGASLRRRGSLKGKKLWSCDSIRTYLASQMSAAERGRE